ncbi:MAG: HAD family hydrolase [Anaerolineales bacterium]
MGRFRVILFDLGNTLIYDKRPWPPILARADQAMRQVLEQAGYPLTPGAYGDFPTIFDLYYHRRQDTLKEETTLSLLRELLERYGASPPDPVLLAAIEALYAITQQNWYPEPDALPTLQTLKADGYQLGILSNAADDRNVQALIDKANLRPYFEFILSSAACQVRKPARRIFRLAIEHFGLPPEQMMMVGDTLEADVQGANRLGIYSVWIMRRAKYHEEGALPYQPQAVISRLSDLPALLEDIGQ